jgi:hypothetical protein
LSTVIDHFDAEIRAPVQQSAGSTPGNDAHGYAGLHKELYPQAVFDVKRFYFRAVIGVGDVTAGQYAIHIQQQNFDRLRLADVIA